MEHLFRILFWIFTLSDCLQAKPYISDFNPELIGTPLCDPGTLFFTPSAKTTNIPTGCVYRCFEAELDNIKRECTITEGQRFFIDMTKDYLNKIQDGPANSENCHCDNWPQRPVQEFLFKMKEVVEEMKDVKRSEQQV